MNMHPSLALVDFEKHRARIEKYAAHDPQMRATFHGTLLSNLFMGSDALSNSAQGWMIDMTREEIAVLHAFASERVPILVAMDSVDPQGSTPKLVSPHGEQILSNLVSKHLSNQLNPAIASLIQVYVASGYMDLAATNFALRGISGKGTYLEAAVLSKNANATMALMLSGARVQDCPSSDMEIKINSGTVRISKGDYKHFLNFTCFQGDSTELREAIEEGMRHQAAQAMSKAIDSAATLDVKASPSDPAGAARRRRQL